MSPSVIENFVVGIVTSVITAIILWLWGKFRRSQILNRKAAFFGIYPQQDCLVILNQNPKTSYKAMAHGDVETLVEIVKLVSEIPGNLIVAPFDRVLEPPGKITEFCIGGPTSNERTKIHLENFLKGVRFNPYAPNDPDRIALVTKEEKFRYEENQNEYMLLARFYPHQGSYPIILICGQTARSNQGAAHYLAQNYADALSRKYGNKKTFCLILKLQSPSIYGYKSVKLVKDLTDTAFIPFVS
jgi:hypothetical protein